MEAAVFFYDPMTKNLGAAREVSWGVLRNVKTSDINVCPHPLFGAVPIRCSLQYRRVVVVVPRVTADECLPRVAVSLS